MANKMTWYKPKLLVINTYTLALLNTNFNMIKETTLNGYHFHFSGSCSLVELVLLLGSQTCEPNVIYRFHAILGPNLSDFTV